MALIFTAGTPELKTWEEEQKKKQGDKVNGDSDTTSAKRRGRKPTTGNTSK